MEYSQAASGPWFDDSLPEPVPPANQCYPAYGVSEGPTNGDIVRAVSDLPSCLQPVYAGSFRYFNTVQSECFLTAYGSDTNMVVAAPTGSGKTGVLELAILRVMSQYIDTSGAFKLNPAASKIVYLAPIRALVQEKVKHWRQTFGDKLGLTCCEMTGDTDVSDNTNLDSADIICTTPEKFDAVTRRRKHQGGMQFFGEVSLVLIDEVHLLSENRGSALETGTISRIKMVSSLKEMAQLPIAKVRFVAVSATIPNIQDIASWLQVPIEGLKTFGEEVRPVKLRTVVKGYAPTKTDFLFERRLNDFIYSVVAENSKSKPALVFCSSRKGTVDTAMHLLSVINKQGRGYVKDRSQQDRLQHAAATTSNRQLQQCLQAGIAFHNAGMEAEERSKVEELFMQRAVLVLCTTSTLAMGVNLPAHLVVLKGTRRWCSDTGETAGYKEYDRSTCLQMIGRAGRPQFDTEGVAVIMTQKQQVQRYQNLIQGAELVESQLKSSFSEYLNAEITLRTVKDISMAISWLKGSFFYIRVRKNPSAYGVTGHRLSEQAIEKILKDQLILTNVKELAKYGMVETDEYGFALEPLVPGQLMAHHYINFKTMKDICMISGDAGLPDLLMAIARSEELSGIKLRRSEKKPLNAINKGSSTVADKTHAVRFYVPDPNKAQKAKERISISAEKIFVMANEGLSDAPADLLDFSMKQELEQVLRVGERIALCMSKYFAHAGRLAATANALLLHKALKSRMWDNSRKLTRQLPGIGNLLAERLADAGIDHLVKLENADPRRIETITQRHYPFGNQIKEELRSRMPPKFSLQVTPLRHLKGGRVQLEVAVARQGPSSSPANRSYAKLIAGSMHDDSLLLQESLVLESFPSPYSVKFTTKEPLPADASALHVVASVILDKLLGLDVTKKVTVPRTATLGAMSAAGSQREVQLPSHHSNDPIDASAQQQHTHTQQNMLQQQPQERPQSEQRHLQQQHQPSASACIQVVDLTQDASQASLQPKQQAAHDTPMASWASSQPISTQLQQPGAGHNDSNQQAVPPRHDRIAPFNANKAGVRSQTATVLPRPFSRKAAGGMYQHADRQLAAAVPNSAFSDLPQEAPTIMPFHNRLHCVSGQNVQHHTVPQQHSQSQHLSRQPSFSQQNDHNTSGHSNQPVPHDGFELSTASAQINRGPLGHQPQASNNEEIPSAGMSSARKRRASQTPPETGSQQSAGGAAGASASSSGFLNVIRSKVKKLQGGTPASSMSTSSIFRPSIFRPSSTSPPLLGHAPRPSALVSRLSQDRYASRPLAPAQGQTFAPATAGTRQWTADKQHAASQPQGLDEPMWNEFLQPEDCLASTHGADASDNYGMQQSGTVSDQPWLQPDAYRYSNCQHVSNAAAFDQRDHTKEGFADLDSMPSDKHPQRHSPLEARLHPFVPSPAAAHAAKQHNEMQLQRNNNTQLTSAAAQSQPSSKLPTGGKGSRRLLVQPLLPADLATFDSQYNDCSSKHAAAVGRQHELARSNTAAEQARKAVRKSLFVCDSNSNRGAELDTSEPTASGSQANVQGAERPQEHSKPALPCKSLPSSIDVPEFSSVFDFL